MHTDHRMLTRATSLSLLNCPVLLTSGQHVCVCRQCRFITTMRCFDCQTATRPTTTTSLLSPLGTYPRRVVLPARVFPARVFTPSTPLHESSLPARLSTRLHSQHASPRVFTPSTPLHASSLPARLSTRLHSQHASPRVFTPSTPLPPSYSVTTIRTEQIGIACQ